MISYFKFMFFNAQESISQSHFVTNQVNEVTNKKLFTLNQNSLNNILLALAKPISVLTETNSNGTKDTFYVDAWRSYEFPGARENGTTYAKHFLSINPELRSDSEQFIQQIETDLSKLQLDPILNKALKQICSQGGGKYNIILLGGTFFNYFLLAHCNLPSSATSVIKFKPSSENCFIMQEITYIANIGKVKNAAHAEKPEIIINTGFKVTLEKINANSYTVTPELIEMDFSYTGEFANNPIFSEVINSFSVVSDDKIAETIRLVINENLEPRLKEKFCSSQAMTQAQ